MDAPAYTYRAHVVRCVDGDTVVLDIDAGLYMTARKQVVRLAGIDTPEMRGPERPAGEIASEWLRSRIEDKDVIVQTIKDKRGDDDRGKYGRWLARIWIDGRCVNDDLLAEGLAVVPGYS